LGGFGWTSDVRLAQHGLEIMSEASGGFAVTNTNDFTSGVKRIVDDLDHYYLLGFYPSDPKGKGYRQLDVRIAGHPEWKLRFRPGYMPGGPPAPGRMTSEMVALSGGVLPKRHLPLRLTAIALPPSFTTGTPIKLQHIVPPAGLAQGAYVLRATLADGAANAVRESGFVVK
jgi:hypothetical protein